MADKEKKKHTKTLGREVRQRTWDLYKENWITCVLSTLLFCFFELIVMTLSVIHPAFMWLTCLLLAMYAYYNVLLAVLLHSGRGKITVTDIFTEFSFNEFLAFIFAVFVKIVIILLVGAASTLLYVGYAIFAHYEFIDLMLQEEGVTFLKAILLPITTSNTAFGVFLLTIFLALYLIVAFGYRYILVEYIEADVIGTNPSGCLTKSKALMDGYKAEAFGSDLIISFRSMAMNTVFTIIFGTISFLATKNQIEPLFTSMFAGEIIDLEALLLSLFAAFSNPVSIIVGILSTLLATAISFTYMCLINISHSELYFALQDIEDNTYIPYQRKKKGQIITTQNNTDVEDDGMETTEEIQPEGLFYQEDETEQPSNESAETTVDSDEEVFEI